MRDATDRCWSRIGVRGDSTCERLAAAGHCRNCEEYSRAGRALLDRECPEPLREEWSRQLAEQETATAIKGDSVLVFQAGGEYLAVRTVLLDRVTGARAVYRVPFRGGPVFSGLVNIDGELLPCFSASAVLCPTGDASQTPPGRMLVLQHQGVRLVCAVDRVIGVMRLSLANLERPPVTIAKSAHSLTTAIFPCKGKTAGLLDGVKLVERFMKSVS